MRITQSAYFFIRSVSKLANNRTNTAQYEKFVRNGI
nr:MAG TPA: hypothetical protein [Caudoviricetes sp.]